MLSGCGLAICSSDLFFFQQISKISKSDEAASFYPIRGTTTQK